MRVKIAPQIACIILAAGLSRRFGSPKMLHPIGKEPLISATLARYQAVFSRVLVVIGHADKELANLLEQATVKTLMVAKNSKGISQSLIAGINATSDADGWLIALGDMPYVQSRTIHRLKAELGPDNIVIPRFQGRQGNPVGFGGSFKSQLLALTGDVGAKSITRQASDKIVFIDTADEGVMLDIDYPLLKEPLIKSMASLAFRENANLDAEVQACLDKPKLSNNE